MIYITGDLHGEYDGTRLKPTHFDYSGLTRSDMIINIGDFGFVWHGDERDDKGLDWLSELPITLLFIDGNHENFDALNAYPVEHWHQGKIHRIRDNVIHLMRGQVYELEGKKYFTFGGGKSIDKDLRVEGVSWWKEEIPSIEEFEEGIRNLDAVDWKVDYVLTHTGPGRVMARVSPHFGRDHFNRFLSTIDKELDFKRWYLGHYHFEKDLDQKHTVLYHSFVKAGDPLSKKEVSRIKVEI